MASMVFNSTNLMILAVIVFVCVNFWLPFIKGKTTDAVVDGFCHPTGEQDAHLIWVCRFSYRLQKAGKRQYCYSKRHFDTLDEAKKAYPKGTEVKIRRYDDNKGVEQALIMSDSKDLHQTLIYTLYAVIGGSAMAVGYQLFVSQLGQ